MKENNSRVIRVLVIDDSAYNRRTLTSMLESHPLIKVIGTAVNGEEGIKKLLNLKPDVVTLDLEMPEMNGFTFLRIVMNQAPLPVLVVSSRKEEANVFKAMELGAVDFLAKPTDKISTDLYNIKDDLINKVIAAKMVNLEMLKRRFDPIAVKIEKGELPPLPAVKEIRETTLANLKEVIGVVGIGASTGGPSALIKVLSKISYDFSHPILITQHMPPGFTRAFAERLNRYSYLKVKEAENNEELTRGVVYIAPGGYNMSVEKDNSKFKIKLRKRTMDDRYVPSVDVLFSSIAGTFGEDTLGIILTGMGNDGKNGLQMIRESGGLTIAESEDTSVVFGMPREAIKSGYVKKVLPIDKVPEEINNWGKELENKKRN
jgi:two-component system chemotaxis response regulator CheB